MNVPITYTDIRLFLDGMLCMMMCYALLHYVQQHRTIYWQYALYIGCMVLDFHLADRGYQQPGYRPGTYFPETFVESVAYVLYIQFAVLLMDLLRTDPTSYRILRWMMVAFVAALVLDSTLLLLNISPAMRSMVYMVSRTLICGAGIIVIPRIFRLQAAVVGYFMAGSACLLVCSVLALGLNYVPVDAKPEPMKTFVFPIVILEVGVVAEVLCFVLGMSLRSRRIEREKITMQAQLIEQLQENERKQQALQRIRQDIARDLHDDLGADLSGLSMLSTVAATQIATQPDEARANLTVIGETARRVITGMREIIWSLNATHLSVESTLFRLRETAYALTEHQPAELHLELPVDVSEDDIPPESRRELFLMFKEILHNAVRHAQAKHIRVQVVVRDQMLCLTVQDDGVGFDVATCKHTGNGLTSLQQRADALGGQLNIDSEPGGGTAVYFCGPVIPQAEPAELATPVSWPLPA